MVQRLNPKALGLSLALLSALCMLFIWIAGNIGLYQGWVNMMMQVHLYFALGVVGLIAGIVEGAIWGFIAGWLVAWSYNKFQ